MKGDFTRNSFDLKKHFTRVLKQQGRVDLDADDNEAGEIQAFLDTLHDLDVIGPAGAPKHAPGFQVTPLEDGSDLLLSAGRLYLSSWLAQNDASPETVSYKTQPNLPNPPALHPVEGRTDLVYLEGWQRHITAAEDPELLEPALGGADTTTRLQMVWQVKVRQNVGAVDCASPLEPWPPLPPLDQRGKLSTSAATTSASDLPCVISPAGGYVGLENRLYRVEIHDGGLPYTWPRPAGAVSLAVSYVHARQVKAAAFLLEGQFLQVGQAVELFSDNTDAAATPGTVAHITAVDIHTRKLTLSADISSFAGHTNLKLRRLATFKWSRDNGSVVYPIQQFVSGEPNKVQMSRLGRDQVLALHPNDWVEVLGDDAELLGQPGTLTQIQPGGIDETRLVLTLGDPVASHKSEPFPKVRRWDQKGAAVAVSQIAGQTIALEDGIQVSFSGSVFLTGDYWTFAARTATGKVDELVAVAPQGIERRFARLAIITWHESLPDANGKTTWKPSTVQTCTPTFPPLTDIWAEDVYYDNEGCDQIEAETVQEAIDALCQQRNLPHHNKHLHGWGIVCGLRVVCGPEDFSEPGDQVSVIVKPGYALDCEGQDIILEQELQVAVIEMIKKWQQEHPDAPKLLTEKDGKLSGQLCLVIERDAHGKPRVDLRPYNPKDDNLKSILQGALLMDFIQQCVLQPLKEIQDYLKKPTGDFEKGSLVPSERQQVITLWNLLIQVFKPQYGEHVFLSEKEHTILENLYYKLVEILISKTFCGMFHEEVFPDYPFPKHEITTLFGAELYRRMRIHPSGKLGYALGVNNHIAVFNLEKDILVEQLEFPGGKEMIVQDVAFSTDGDELWAVATSTGGDSLFALAKIENGKHEWQPTVRPVCGLRLVTLLNTPYSLKQLYAIANGKGLFLLDPHGDVIRPHPVHEFVAVGHLVIDESQKIAYATAGTTKDTTVQVTNYDRVLAIDLKKELLVATYPLGDERTGRDDIALFIPARHTGDFEVHKLESKGRLLFVVVNPPAQTPTANKQLAIFNTLKKKPVKDYLDLGSNTEIRLQALPSTPYLVISYEDEYWLRLLELSRLTLVSDYHFPVQISPIDMAYDPGLDLSIIRELPRPRGEELPRFYVLNALSPTLTAFPVAHINPENPEIAPAPGSDEFFKVLVDYRQEILRAFLGLLTGILQSLKDCFCDRLLIDCPSCDPDDEVYLAKVTVKDSEVFQVCNFSRRKYVKSFPTLEYWLSLLPVLPLVDKAIESFCCAVLPDFFNLFTQKRMAVNMKGLQMRQTYAFIQQRGIQNLRQSSIQKLNLARSTSLDWAGNNLSRMIVPAMGMVKGQDLLQLDVSEAQNRLEAAKVEVVGVETYDAADGPQNLRRITTAPAELPPGTKVTLYAENGVVRYYALAEKITPPGTVGTVTAADMEAVQAELEIVKAQAAKKDKELLTLHTQLKELETKQTKALEIMRKDLDRLMPR